MTDDAPKAPLCPICKQNESAQGFRPFCSARCADVDLHRWLGGRYSVPAVEPPDHFSDEEAENKDIH